MPKKRQAYILNRGAYDNPTTPVNPEMPSSILAFDDQFSKDRLGLAKWLFSKNNPLTARVSVNRLWQQCFGKGIVATPDDFGNQGSLPTHPNLLDYLALKFQNEGWDTKAMLKYMVMSATFQQATKINPELLEKDPENNFLARYSRLRLSSEMIRDQVLKSSGLLYESVGGPSVKPYQPEGLWAETIGGGGDLRTYVQDKGNQLYRRSLYTFWKRTVPPPSMTTFDASTKDLCTIKRQETNTPLQALVLLNDPQIIEAARQLANKAMKLEEKDIQTRIKFMFEIMTSRSPIEKEVVLLEKYYQQEISTIDEQKAKAYTSLGNSPLEAPISIKELAAYSLVATVIFNLDEVINRG